MKDENTTCSILDSCERVVPLWLILLDNIPTVVLFLLGAILVGFLWWPLGIFMMIYNLCSIILFWSRICPHCRHFGTRACPCGYGVVAARYFQSRRQGDFRKIFRKNIAIMYPCWFIPACVGIYLLYERYSPSILAFYAAFLVVGFVMIPLISRFVGCRGCTLKDQCPWMSGKPDAASKAGGSHG